MSSRRSRTSFDRQKTLTPRRPKLVLNQIDFVIGENQQLKRQSESKPVTPRPGRPPPARAKTPRSFHTIATRLGNVAIPETPHVHTVKVKKMAPNTSNEPSVIVVTERESVTAKDYEQGLGPDVYITFDLLKAIVPRKISHLLERAPLFLKTLYNDGKLDPDIISSITIRLTPTDLRRFMLNYSQETNFYGAVMRCNSIYEVEQIITNMLPILKTLIWTWTENTEYIISQTLNDVLPVRNSIVGYALLKEIDIITSDPGNSPGYSVDVDMRLFRNYNSMALFPIISGGHVFGVLQCLGYTNSILQTQTGFSNYHIEVLKIVRNILQDKFYSHEPEKVVPAEVSTAFDDIYLHSYQKVVKRIEKLLQDLIPCDIAEIYNYNDRRGLITRLSDNTVYNKNSGGVTYAAALMSDPISVPHGKTHPAFNQEIDGRLTNRSIMAKSYLDNRNHYVVTLRAKWKSPAFTPEDLELLDEIAPVMCDNLRLSNILTAKTNNFNNLKRESTIIELTNKILSSFVNTSNDLWTSFRDYAHNIFDCETCFVCIFDGRNMRFFPTTIMYPFDLCIAGESYNFREERKIDLNEQQVDTKLYLSLGLKMNTSIAFPYRSFKKVIGSIELINPDPKLVDDFAQKMACIVCSLLFPDLVDTFSKNT